VQRRCGIFFLCDRRGGHETDQQNPRNHFHPSSPRTN
jgi:hypothetical protein